MRVSGTGILAPPLSACPPPGWGKVTNLFVFPGAPVLVLSANSIHQVIRAIKELGGRRPTQPSAKRSPHQTTSSSGRPSWTQIHKLHLKSSIAQENWFHAQEVPYKRNTWIFLWVLCVERTCIFLWVKCSKKLKGQSRAPSVSISPSHFTKMTRMQNAHFH